MTKTAARPGPAPKPIVAEAPPAKKKAEAEKPKESFRDLVEQVVVAILLAILIRGFDAEAFVIPTGSMAPTLKGRHKEIACPQCGYLYAVNSSEEAEAYFNENPEARANELAVCENCRWAAPVGDAPSFKGDRILVMKFPYEFPWLPGCGGPDRWDVVVFHYPERPEQNYIKRLVGLPNEDLRIQRGNLFTRPVNSSEPFRVARKPQDKVRAIAMLVNDDRHRSTLLKDRPEWLRWRPSAGVQEAKEGEFTFNGNVGGASLRYRHLVPDPEQWIAIARNQVLPRAPRPSLITDFYSYNASTAGVPREPLAAWFQSDWVGDLLLEFDLEIDAVHYSKDASPTGDESVTIELVESGVRNRCVIEPGTGRAVLYHGSTKLGEAETRIKGVGRHSIGFANVDDRLTLWVDGARPFGDGLPYDDPASSHNGPTAADLDPVGISTSEVSARVSGLVLKRDIYYTKNPSSPDCPISGGMASFDPGNANRPYAPVVQMFDVLSDPAKFGPMMGESEPGEPFSIRGDNFMMMGDNSPRSHDGRAWGRLDRSWDDERGRNEVPRDMLIGKAFFVYWPHGVPFGPDIRLSRDVRVPFRPNFERMKPIR